MNDPYNLARFLEAQDPVFDIAIAELAAGRKQTHWMWFIFPQLAGLGRSSIAAFYAIGSLDEARAYRRHSVLAQRLERSLDALLGWSTTKRAEDILGATDAAKLRSSLTLFQLAEPNRLFEKALQAFFAGSFDQRTLALLNAPA